MENENNFLTASQSSSDTDVSMTGQSAKGNGKNVYHSSTSASTSHTQQKKTKNAHSSGGDYIKGILHPSRSLVHRNKRSLKKRHCHVRQSEKITEDDFMEAFSVFDRNKDGFITTDDLFRALSALIPDVCISLISIEQFYIYYIAQNVLYFRRNLELLKLGKLLHISIKTMTGN